ncbi:hypothetical protein V6N13_088845 [Hibiscus sabdariffa]
MSSCVTRSSPKETTAPQSYIGSSMSQSMGGVDSNRADIHKLAPQPLSSSDSSSVRKTYYPRNSPHENPNSHHSYELLEASEILHRKGTKLHHQILSRKRAQALLAHQWPAQQYKPKEEPFGWYSFKDVCNGDAEEEGNVKVTTVHQGITTINLKPQKWEGKDLVGLPTGTKEEVKDKRRSKEIEEGAKVAIGVARKWRDERAIKRYEGKGGLDDGSRRGKVYYG